MCSSEFNCFAPPCLLSVEVSFELQPARKKGRSSQDEFSVDSSESPF